jgi:hypothetical protein
MASQYQGTQTFGSVTNGGPEGTKDVWDKSKSAFTSYVCLVLGVWVGCSGADADAGAGREARNSTIRVKRLRIRA